MADYLGQIQSYVNTEPNKIMVTDRILNTDPLKIATYLRLGANVGGFNMVNMDGKEYRWLEDTYASVTTAVATSGTFTTSSAAITFTPSSLTIFQPGDLLKIDDEKLWVSAVDSGLPTVTRGWGSTTAATHASAAVVTVIGRARIDGDDADDSPNSIVASSTNYTQIFQRTVEVARTKQKMAQYGISDPMGYEIDKKMDALLMLLNNLPYYGERAIGSASLGRTAGGFRQYITDNSTDCASAALTRDHIDDLLQDIYADGGDPDLILCGAFAQRKLNSFYEGFITTERSEELGGNMIKKLMNPITGKQLDVIVDRACPADELWVLESDKIAFYPFDPFFYEELAQTGDALKGEVVGEYGFICQADKHHGFLDGFSTTS